MFSLAHQRSASFVIDPLYSATAKLPRTAVRRSWLYAAGEYECFMLRRLRDNAAAARLNVGYPGVFHEPSARALFRRTVKAGKKVSFTASGAWIAALDGREIASGLAGAAAFAAPASGELIVAVTAEPPRTLPGLRPGAARENWDAAADGGDFSPAVSGGEPDGDRLPRKDLALKPARNAPAAPHASTRFYDAERELLACVEIVFAPEITEKPEVNAGETLAEAMSTAADSREQAPDWNPVRPGVWQSAQPLAFRYLRVTSDARPKKVTALALFTPVQYRGAFAADAELSRIWMASAYTMRLCLHYFHIDGIKRDRLPWAGDLAVSLLANAYTFYEPEPIARTLTALGRAGIGEAHINGITDYSLWYLICHDLYQRYFADMPFLRRQYPGILDIMAELYRQADDGFLPDGKWLFIDWVEGEKTTALQMLFHETLLAMGRMADRMGDAARAARARAHAAHVRDRLRVAALSGERGLFFSRPGAPESGFARHANIFAVLYGVADADECARIAAELAKDELPPVATPYMAALEILALHRGGQSAAAIAKIRKIWGGMLDAGATTFWEGYDASQTGDARFAFYGRPFAKSLCHAWSAGPAALLPIVAFNCVPSADGWAASDAPVPEPFAGGWAAAVPVGNRILTYPEE